MISFSELASYRPDVIVAGGGTAGCVVASRISERLPSMRVLLVEAGPDSSGIAIIDRSDRVREAKRYHDWGFKTVAQPELRGHEVAIERGKVLGGSSCIMWMGHVRGNPEDWNEIERQTGVKGWSYRDMLPAFKRFENFISDPALADAGYHGTSGPIAVRSAGFNVLGTQFMRACNALGVGLGAGGRIDPSKGDVEKGPSDYNGRVQAGTGPMQMFMDSSFARSANTAKGYIHPFIDPSLPGYRPNLRVLVRTQVTRVLFDATGGGEPRARGIECLVDGKTATIMAAKEVVVSAGAFQSPQLLMLSGIGPREHLAEHGIECIVDNQHVGQNLGDHLLVHIAFRSEPWPEMPLWPTVTFFSTPSYAERLEKAGVPVAPNIESYPLSTALEFILADRQKETIDVQPLGPLSPDETWDAAVHRAKGFITNVPTRFEPNFHFQVVLNKVKSRGSVTLAGANPLLPPKIDPRYLSEREDLEDFCEGLEGIRAIVGEMRKRNSGLHEEIAEEAILGEVMRVTGLDREAALAHRLYLEEFIRRQAATVWHPCGTCALGRVVDGRCRVMGTRGLRVVDASLFDPAAGNIMSAVVASAERAAELMLEDLQGELIKSKS
ncbi:GMC oxidoreductase-domain-containing protein [Hyaloraphidium curvatum]|nr:GMC oxidoreductase-domain-containing protein [Hyaloraphidium curvatum]